MLWFEISYGGSLFCGHGDVEKNELKDRTRQLHGFKSNYQEIMEKIHDATGQKACLDSPKYATLSFAAKHLNYHGMG
jgi:hypothetical protein